MGVVVRRYMYIHLHNNCILLFPTPLVLALFLPAVSLLLCSFLKCFSFLCMLFLCNIANVAQRIFEIVQKLRSREHGDIIIDKNVCASVCESRGFYVRGTA